MTTQKNEGKLAWRGNIMPGQRLESN